MLNNIKKHIVFGNRFCGIEHSTKNNKDIIYGCILKKNKQELNIASLFEIKSIDEASQKISKNQHALLVINNNNVITKTIESTQNDTLTLLYKEFPNINIKDFYYEVLHQGHKHFISLCRKDYVNKIIDAYTKQNILIIGLSLGNYIINLSSSYINATSIYTSNALIELVNQNITLIKKEHPVKQDYNINNLKLTNFYVLSFCGALKVFLNNTITQTNFVKKETELLNNYKHSRFFNQFLKIGGLLILVTLLINFFLFNYFFNKVNQLEQTVLLNNNSKNEIIKLNKLTLKKQKKAINLLKNNKSKTSFYTNTIAVNLPKSILLTEFNYQPLLSQVKSNSPIIVEKNKINIAGMSNNSKAFSNWIAKLEQEKWITKVSIVDYGSNTLNTSNFKIKISLNNE